MKLFSFLKGGTEILVTFVGGEQIIFMNLNPIPGAPLVVKNDTSLMSTCSLVTVTFIFLCG